MDRKTFLGLLDEVLELEPGTLTGSEELQSLEAWDSLTTLSFIAMIDEQFGITLPTDNIAQAKTMNDLIALLGDRVK